MSDERPNINDNSEKQANSRLELKKRLFQAQQLLKYIIENDFTAIAVLDRDLKYVYVSRKTLTDYNINETDILGKSHYEVFPDIPYYWKEVHERALAGETLKADEEQFIRSDGTIMWVRWECKPWYESEGLIGGIVLYTEVITKRKEIELELKKAKEKAEESDRLKTAFLQNISHEIRTPLNSIVGFSELISFVKQDSEKSREYSKIIAASSNKLINIVSDVVDISQIQSGQVNVVPSKFEISPLLDKVADEFRSLATVNGVELSVHKNVPEDSLTIVSDKRKIEKILFHLLDNAVKYTKEGYIKLIYHIINGSLFITVSDSGIGISPENQKKIFDPFWRAETGINRRFGGTGIGLPIVKEYTKLLGGSVSLTSVVNRGTTINIKLPVRAKILNRKADNLKKASGTNNSTIRIHTE